MFLQKLSADYGFHSKHTISLNQRLIVVKIKIPVLNNVNMEITSDCISQTVLIIIISRTHSIVQLIVILNLISNSCSNTSTPFLLFYRSCL